MARRVLVWVQNLLGSGHLGRAQNLGLGLVGEGFEVTLVHGGPPLPWLSHAPLEMVQLPPVSAADAAFTTLVGGDGRPADAALWTGRRQRLLDLFERLRPAAVVTEMFPFGRRAFRGELVPLLERARAVGALRVASVRDVLVEARPEKLAWMRDLALAHYDLLLAHTDPRVLPFALTFPHRDELGDRLVETGFVVPPPRPPQSPLGRGEVIVSAGGGRVGQALLETALAARRLARSPVPWRLIVPDEATAGRLAGAVPDGIVLDRQRPDFRDLLANGLLSVSQAGYNTVWEAFSYEKRMVLVPFEHAGETEQRTRATRLATLGLARLVPEGELSPASLAAAVAQALARPAPAPAGVDLDGARRSARLITSRLGPEVRR